MTTTTCLVCGAAEEPAGDHTCPVCGADLPVEPDRADTDDAVSREGEAPVADDAPAAGASVPEEAPEPTQVPAADTTAGSGTAGPEMPTWPVAPPPPATGPTSAGAPPPPPPAGVPANPPPAAHDPSHPSGIPAQLRTYGMLTHLSAFAGAIVALAFVGPLVMWLIRRDEHPFLDHHGKEALNFNLSMLLYGVIGIIASIATLGVALVVVVPAAIVFFVTWVVTTIIAAVRANNGEGYRYPLTIRFVGDDV